MFLIAKIFLVIVILNVSETVYYSNNPTHLEYMRASIVGRDDEQSYLLESLCDFWSHNINQIQT